jgi:hypothetical protein
VTIRLCALVAALAAVIAIAACGDDEQTTVTVTTSSAVTASTSSTTTITDPTTTTSSATTTTSEPADEPAASPEDAVSAVLTGEGSPRQACDEFVTTAFLQISYGGRQNCIAARTPNALANSVEVKSSEATATGVHLVVVPEGGPYDGAKVEVEVIADGDGYRVDSLQAHIPAGP